MKQIGVGFTSILYVQYYDIIYIFPVGNWKSSQIDYIDPEQTFAAQPAVGIWKKKIMVLDKDDMGNAKLLLLGGSQLVFLVIFVQGLKTDVPHVIFYQIQGSYNIQGWSDRVMGYPRKQGYFQDWCKNVATIKS